METTPIHNASFTRHDETSLAGVTIPPSPGQLSERTPKQVFRDHLDAINSGDLDQIAKDYTADAFILLTHEPSPILGLDGIRTFFSNIYAATGGPADISIKSITAYHDIVTVEWGLRSPKLNVGDGVDTFVIKNGLITQQAGRLGDLSMTQ